MFATLSYIFLLLFIQQQFSFLVCFLFLSLQEKLRYEFIFQKQVNIITEQQRVLITAPDAFGYFGRAYGMDVKGLQGLSNAAEYGLKDVTNLVDFISENKI